MLKLIEYFKQEENTRTEPEFGKQEGQEEGGGGGNMTEEKLDSITQ